MRKRAMSMYISAKDVNLSQKMKDVSDDDSSSSGSEEEEEAPEYKYDASVKKELNHKWTTEDIKIIVEKFNNIIPKQDHLAHSTRLKKINWDDIVFNDHTTDEIRHFVETTLKKIRQRRTLAEMLPEMEAVYLKQFCPKRPATGFGMYVKESWAKRGDEFRNLPHSDVMKILSEGYHKLPESKRKAYKLQTAQLAKEYSAAMENYKESYKIEGVKKERAQKRNPQTTTPFGLYYEYRKAHDSIDRKLAKLEWETLPISKKVVWIKKVFTEKEANSSISNKLSKNELKMLEESNGKPADIGANVYIYFRKKKHGTPNDELVENFKNLSPIEKSELKAEYELARNKYVAEYTKYVDSLPQDQREEELQNLKNKAKSKKKTENKSPTKPAKPDTNANKSKNTSIAQSTESDETDTILPKGKRRHSDTGLPEKVTPKQKKKSKNDEMEPKAAEKVSKIKEEKIYEEVPESPKKGVKKRAKTNNSLQAEQENGEETYFESPKKSKTKKEKVVAEIVTPVVPNSRKKGKNVSKEEVDEPIQSPKKKAKLNSSIKVEKDAPKPMEPKKPPQTLFDYFKTHIYKGSAASCKTSFNSLSNSKRLELASEFKLLKTVYITDFEKFLKSLSKAEIQKYFAKAQLNKSVENDKKKAESESESGSESGSEDSEGSDDE